VKKASEYRQHAAECREMARKATTPQRDQLLEMAKTWGSLAEDRDKQIARQERTDRQMARIANSSVVA
jgi:hypothetical protein